MPCVWYYDYLCIRNSPSEHTRMVHRHGSVSFSCQDQSWTFNAPKTMAAIELQHDFGRLDHAGFVV